MRKINRTVNLKRKESIVKLLDIDKILKSIEDKRVVIFGTTEVAEVITDILDKYNCDFDFYIDTDPIKQKVKMYNEKDVYSLYKLLEVESRETCIIMASFNWEENIELLINLEVYEENSICIPFLNESINYNLTYKYDYNTNSAIIDINNEKLQVLNGFDPIGKVILDTDKKNIYRIIYKEYEEDVSLIYNILKINNFLDMEVIDTEIIKIQDIIKTNKSNLSDILLKHRYIKSLILPHEFSKDMLERGGIFILELIKKLNKVNLTLKDANIKDITFFNGDYVFLDFGSIIIKNEFLEINFIDNFINRFINNLLYINKVQKYKNEFLKVKEEINLKDIIGYLSIEEKEVYLNNKKRVYTNVIKGDIEETINSLMGWLIECNTSTIKTNWTDYHKNKKISASLDVKQKDEALVEILKDTKISSVIDIGGNSGHYSYILAEKGVDCILTDIDSSAVDKAFSYIEASKIKNVTPMVKEFSVLYTETIESIDRIKSDLVMMLALVHHLIFAQQMTFDKIIEICYSISGKYLLIEFIENEDDMIKDFNNEMFDWYNLEEFNKSILRKFNIVRKIKTEKYRTVFLCEKIK